ncbi:MAG: 2,3-diaminopropionate biosynthesis protein SbnA [Acidobacteria bacterium]|nr:MAG: 2,3-diaminopropionate biosynthesis protein SbnA [Acidobacteriota bacterium]
MLADGVLAAVGRTPLIRLRRVVPGLRFRLYAKLEGLNPGGSAKDRAERAMIEQAREAGEIDDDTVVIESTSGNTGIGLAQACRSLGLRFIAVVDPMASRQNLSILRAFGAEVDLIEEPDQTTGEYIHARRARVETWCRRFPNHYFTDQHANPSNARAHRQSTMPEILADLDGALDYLFCGVSTCGTLRGCAEHLRQRGLDTRVIAVDAVGSMIFGRRKHPRLIPGLGAGERPELCPPRLVDRVVQVSDRDCVVGCRRLAAREALLVGGSSGGVLSALERLKDRIPRGATCALIFPDRGERYLDTIFDDDWVREHLGDVAHLWRDGDHAPAAEPVLVS